MMLLLATTLLTTHASWAKKAPKTDYISLAAMMIKDGHYDRALLALQSVDLEDEEIDLARFYTLQGLAYMNLSDRVAAKDSLTQAIKNGQKDPVIYIYLAQVNYALKEYSDVIAAVNSAEAIIRDYPTLLEMKAQSQWHLKQTDAAINTLNKAQQMIGDDYRFMRRKVFYLMELKLYQQAALLGKQYLNTSAGKASDYIAIGNALRLSKEYQQTLNIMEAARLRFPANVTIAKVLAHTYIDMGKLNSGAFILEQAAQYDPKLLAEASEVYRRAGRYYKSLTMTTSIRNIKVKLKQRLAIYLALKRYEQAANMKKSLYRNGLLEDENIRYALAYAYFSSGQYDAASRQIDFLKEPELFKKGVELRRMMASCNEEPWQCT